MPISCHINIKCNTDRAVENLTELTENFNLFNRYWSSTKFLLLEFDTVEKERYGEKYVCKREPNVQDFHNWQDDVIRWGCRLTFEEWFDTYVRK
jgi:hypothetical protein